VPFDFSELKKQVRQTVHVTMSVPAIYTHDSAPGVETELRVRWHNKIARVGDLLEAGYSEVVDGINRVIFNVPELIEKGVVLARGGRITLDTEYYDGAQLILETKEPRVGPVEEIWLIAYDR
jgi:hypothetical protein